jgi:hypothetical protein
MYETTPSVYLKIAELLLAKIGTRDFFSGSVTLHDGDVECRLICTLVVSRERHIPYCVVELLPVWWEFRTSTENGELSNDFSFSEMISYIE